MKTRHVVQSSENNSHKLVSDGFFCTYIANPCKVNTIFWWLQRKHCAVWILPPPPDSQDPSSLSTSPLSVLSTIHVTCGILGDFTFTWNSSMYLCFFFLEEEGALNGCWYDCIPTDLIIKGESRGEWERWRGQRKEMGRPHSSLQVSPSGRHRSSDVTNAVNVLACLQCGAAWASQANRRSAARLLSYTSQRLIQRSNLNFCLTWFFIFT